jgi:hypothetical protein
MKSERFFLAFNDIEESFIDEDALKINFPGLTRRLRLALPTAACLCLLALGAYFALGIFMPGVTGRPGVTDKPGVTGKPVIQWSKNFKADNYFKYNDMEDGGGASSSSSFADAALPYQETRSFSGMRERLEAEGVIPAMPGHPLYDCGVNYNADGSIYSLSFLWHSRNPDVYSDLSITAGYQEVEKITDCIFIEVDDNGNIVEPAVTVTERDGVRIVAEGNANRDKTLTFQNENGWYQIEGSWNDGYTEMAALLDWVWEHPVDFSLFPIDAGDNFTYTGLGETPGAFAGYIPDFYALGYFMESDHLTLKNGVPYAFEGQYIGNVPEESVKDWTFYDYEDWTLIHWCVMTEPEYYYLAESLGDLNELTEQAVYDCFDEPGNQSNVSFYWDGLFIKVYANSARELWAVLETLK